MTVHAAKGLEFKNVFVVGLEEDLFPSAMSKDNPRAIEEERRLFYVAITRAEEHCMLTCAKSRFRNGQSMMCSPSRFLRDIDKRFILLPADGTADASMVEPRPRFQQPSGYEQQPSATWRQPRITPVEQATARATSSASTSAGVSDLTVGAKVQHDRFGRGEVIAMEGEGNNRKAIVNFEQFGQKQLLLKFARRTVI